MKGKKGSTDKRRVFTYTVLEAPLPRISLYCMNSKQETPNIRKSDPQKKKKNRIQQSWNDKNVRRVARKEQGKHDLLFHIFRWDQLQQTHCAPLQNPIFRSFLFFFFFFFYGQSAISLPQQFLAQGSPPEEMANRGGGTPFLSPVMDNHEIEFEQILPAFLGDHNEEEDGKRERKREAGASVCSSTMTTLNDMTNYPTTDNMGCKEAALPLFQRPKSKLKKSKPFELKSSNHYISKF